MVDLDTSRINEFIERITNEFSYLNIEPSLDSNEIEYNNTDLTIEIISSSKAKIKYENGYIREFTLSKCNGVICFF